QIAVPPTFKLRGDPDNAASYVIDGGQQAAIVTVLGKSLHVDGVTLQSEGNVCVASAMTGSEIVLHTIRFNTCAGGAVFAYGGAMIWQQGRWDVSGDSPWLIYVNQGSTYSPMGAGSAITFNGARSFSNFVLGSARGASITLAGVSLSGASVTGQKWATACGGTIDANGVVLNTIIPGTIDGGDRTATLCPP